MLNSHIKVLQQVIDLLGNISSQDFQRVMQPHMTGSIGQHLRHVVDHYLALEKGYECGLIDYDQRNREADIEVSINAAKETIQALQTWLSKLSEADLSKPVQVRSEISLSEKIVDNCPSTLAREIMFVSSHAVHHFSLIGIIRSLQGQPVPEFFGYAPTTISYLNEHSE